MKEKKIAIKVDKETADKIENSNIDWELAISSFLAKKASSS